MEIDVDAMPDKKFEGVVASVNAATGASTSLLPPDNATGNFTKVVQRIPVKIAITPSTKGGKWAGQEDFNRLAPGHEFCDRDRHGRQDSAPGEGPR